jgi:histidinol-phosphate aminotransferase
VPEPEPIESVAAVERHREGGRERDGFVPLDRNERVGPMPEWFVERLRDAVDSDLMTSYPATDELHAELAASLDLSPDQVLITPGTDPVLRAMCQAYVRPGDTIAMLEPSYAMYRVYAKMFGAREALAGFDSEFKADTDTLLDAVSAGARIAFVANPNQPTGTTLDDDVLRDLVARAEESGTAVVLDEAYMIFGGTDALPHARSSPNAIVARTFSKAGLAGVRIGYVAGSPSIVHNLRRVRSAADTSALAIAAARILVQHPELATDYAAEVAAGYEVIAERARALGFEPLPSAANFISIRVGSRERGVALVDALKERGYLISGPYPEPPLHDSIRVTLGPPDVMHAFADALADAAAATP